MKKKVLKILAGVAILLIVLVLVAWLFIDSIVKMGIEKGGSYAMGVPTKVKTVKLSLLNGTLMIDNLQVGNPAGFTTPHLMKTGRFNLEVRSASVFGSPVEVRQFVLDGLDVNIERAGGKCNVSAVLDNLKKMGGDKPAAKEQKPAGPGKKVSVSTVTIKNVVAHVQLGLLGDSKPLTIPIPSIELKDVTDENGVPTAELMGRLLPAILAAVMEKGKGLIPSDLAGPLNENIASAAGSIGGAAKLLRQSGGEAASKLGQQAGEAVKEAGKLTDPLKGLLGPKPSPK